MASRYTRNSSLQAKPKDLSFIYSCHYSCQGSKNPLGLISIPMFFSLFNMATWTIIGEGCNEDSLNFLHISVFTVNSDGYE